MLEFIPAQVVQPFRWVLIDLRKNVRWVVAFIVVIFLWSILSSFLFWMTESGQGVSLADAFYFTFLNLTTGPGDIVPKSGWGKTLSVINSLFGIMLFGIFISILCVALQSEGSNAAAGTPEQQVVALLSNLKAILIGHGQASHLQRIVIQHPDGSLEIHILLRKA
jgi:hypothetical protein